MKISQLRIENFRSFEDQTIFFDDYTCFVGPNGSGKSTVLNALNILFRNFQSASNVTSLEEEDFHLRGVDRPVIITATFTDLSEKAKDDLKAYVRQNKLILSAKAVWDKDTRAAQVQQLGQREVIKDFSAFFKAEKENAKASELKKIYLGIKEAYTELPAATTKDGMKEALREYEEARPDLCTLVESTDQFYGWSKGTNLLEQHCQWVYIPAVKDPTEEQQEGKSTALGALLQRTIRSHVSFKQPIEELRREIGTKYQDLLQAQQDALKDVGQNLQERLRDWAHPGARIELVWHFDEGKSIAVTEPMARAKIGEGEFLGDMVRVGHGMQRSFVVSLLQVLSKTHEGDQPTLILGFEEPELYQHPPQARHLSSLLEELSKGDNQIIVTTHSPYFVSARGFENVRMTRPLGVPKKTMVSQLNYHSLSERISTAMGAEPSPPTSVMAAVEQIMQPSQNELFFSHIPVLVEGQEDIAFISTHLHLSNKWTEFRRYGCHFVVCNGKTSLSRPLAICRGFGIPAFVIFDGDCDGPEKEKAKNANDNRCILNLCEITDDPMPKTSYFCDSMVMWCTRIMDEVQNEIGNEKWKQAEDKARRDHMLSYGVRKKNPLIISATLENLWSDEIKSNHLEKICQCLLVHARKHIAA